MAFRWVGGVDLHADMTEILCFYRPLSHPLAGKPQDFGLQESHTSIYFLPMN